MNNFNKDGDLPIWQKILIVLGALFQGFTVYVVESENFIKYLPTINLINFAMFLIVGMYISYLYRQRKLDRYHIGMIAFMDVIGFVAFIQLVLH